MSSSEGYILNAVQTPGPLFPVFNSIDSGNCTKDELASDTGVDANLDATLEGLNLLRLIGREDGEYYTEPLEWETGSHKRDLQMSALHNLVDECSEDSWGKQAVVLLNYHYLLNNNIQHFENNDESLYSDIDDWFTQIGYQPRSQQGRITHNDPKFGNWTRLTHFLGLIHKVRGREHTVYPSPDMIMASIELAVRDAGDNVDGHPVIEIEQYLHWLRQNMLFVKKTSDGAIPEGLAQVLFELVRDEEIELAEYGDAGAVGLDGVPPYEGVDNAANTIRVK